MATTAGAQTLDRLAGSVVRRYLELRASAPAAVTGGRAKARETAPRVTARAMNDVERQDREVQAAIRGVRLRRALRLDRPLRVAVIMDPYTRLAFDAESDLYDLHPDRWQRELEDCRPDLLFIESAWRGDADSWHDTVQHKPPELVDIVEWCHRHGIPSVFWMKEDPVYYDRYIEVAKLFDHVFTTDLEKIPSYLRDLKHGRVHVLPFAAQPLDCNPVRRFERQDAAVFAGSYYPGFQERNKRLFAMIDGASRVMPVEIYDRNLESGNPILIWPDPYDQLIVGTLAPEEIDVAYKGYALALNVNTVTDSQTMAARRVFDLVASGTPVITNASLSMSVLFGDLVDACDSADDTETAARRVLDDPDWVAKRSEAGVLRMLEQHTYAHRFRRVLEVVTRSKLPERLPYLILFARADDRDQLDRWAQLAQTSRLARSELVIVTDNAEIAALCEERQWRHLTSETAGLTTVADLCPCGAIVGALASGDWYGPHYIDSLVAGLTYTRLDAALKGAYSSLADDGIESRGAALEHRILDNVRAHPRQALFRQPLVSALSVGSLLADGPDTPLPPIDAVSVDRFDYCASGGAFPQKCAALTSSLDLAVGTTMSAVYDAEPRFFDRVIRPKDYPRDQVLPAGNTGAIVRATDEGVVIAWAYDDDQTHRLPFPTSFATDDITTTRQVVLNSSIAGSDGLRSIAVRWENANGARLSGEDYPTNASHRLNVPATAVRARLSLVVAGEGSSYVRFISLGDPDPGPGLLLDTRTSDTLILTDAYPSPGDLYRNGFVHKRVTGYQRAGLQCDVFVLRGRERVTQRGYQGVRIMTGVAEDLRRFLASGRYKRVLVHFLNATMWKVLKLFLGTIPVVVWIHGAEIQPYWRREFNYTNDEERTKAIQASDARMDLWREVSLTDPDDAQFVFVSNAFRDEVQADLGTCGISLETHPVTVIHNPVDAEIFDYAPKAPEQRDSILLVRPFASRKYANDLAIEAIIRLSTEPWFGELQFDIYGDGPQWESDTAPLREFWNVSLHRTFLTHEQIAQLHKRHGVFLVPTRADAQGVSRDEAMSSGLVPITTDIPAIHEFVSGQEGYIAPYDDAQGLADAIRDLHFDPEGFQRKSAASAERVRATVASQVIIPQELALILSTNAREG